MFTARTKTGRQKVQVPRRGDFDGPAKLPRMPTTRLPGSAAKVTVMAKRAIQGLQLFHPDDAKTPDNDITPEWTPADPVPGAHTEVNLDTNRGLFLTALDRLMHHETD